MDPVPDLILPEKFLGYSRKSNPGPLGWQSDVLVIKLIEDRQERLLLDGCIGVLVVRKALSLNLNISFLNQISLLLIKIATNLDGPHSRPYISRKIVGFSPEPNPGPLGWQLDVLTTIPKRRSKTIQTGTN